MPLFYRPCSTEYGQSGIILTIRILHKMVRTCKTSLLLFFLVPLIFSLITSCGSPRGAVNPEQRLIHYFKQWEGTPYRLGGNNKNGIDCSAFVQIIMKDAFNVNIPRTTREQMTAGREISARSARLGDLVFFQTGRTSFHVGIIMRRDYFMHASTSRGVTIDRLREPYWRERIIGYRRFGIN